MHRMKKGNKKSGVEKTKARQQLTNKPIKNHYKTEMGIEYEESEY